MLILHDSPAGYMLFRLLDESKAKDPKIFIEEVDKKKNLHKLLKLESFKPFKSTTDAVSAATALIDGHLEKPLKKFLKKNLSENDTLALLDTKLAKAIKKKLNVNCEVDEMGAEIVRVIREHVDEFMPEKKNALDAIKSMQLGLAHSLSRYKLKFSPDKVDTMIVQAIGLLDELDKELNIYAMRVREWYGWHFPELGKLIEENVTFAKIVLKVGNRLNFKNTDLSDILEEENEKLVKSTCEISMGTDISEEDVETIKSLAVQVVDLTTYRAQLFDYLKNRMQAIAPNLTTMVGELVGARLISQAGSLLNLAKAPASTVQILGAEKALFRALKTKHDTPKYGLLYHASLVGQAGVKNKGKISRVLAAKASLAIRVDALGEEEGVTIGLKCREQVERRLRILEESNPAARKALEQQFKKYVKPEGEKKVYDETADVVLDGKSSKRKIEVVEDSPIEEKNEKGKDKEKKEKKKDKKKKQKTEDSDSE